MAERVVDELEVVEVDEQDRGLARFDDRELVLHLFGERATVEQTGERVVARLVHEIVLRGTPPGDVDGLQDRLRPLAEVRELEVLAEHPATRSVRAQDLILALGSVE